MTSERLKRVLRDCAMAVLGGGVVFLSGFAQQGGPPEAAELPAGTSRNAVEPRASAVPVRPGGKTLRVDEAQARVAAVASEPRVEPSSQAAGASGAVAAVGGAAPTPSQAQSAPTATTPKRSPFDLTKAEWQEQAQKSAVKFRVPCQRPKGWAPEDADLEGLGLDPAIKPAIREAYRLSNERVFRSVADVCGGTIGDVRVAEKILANQRMGLTACVSLVLEDDFKRDPGMAEVSLRAVAEIQAGSVAAARVEPTLTPTGKLMLALSREAGAFEADLARLLSPELAERIVHDDSLNSYRGQKPVCLYGDAYTAEGLRHQVGW